METTLPLPAERFAPALPAPRERMTPRARVAAGGGEGHHAVLLAEEAVPVQVVVGRDRQAVGAALQQAEQGLAVLLDPVAQ